MYVSLESKHLSRRKKSTIKSTFQYIYVKTQKIWDKNRQGYSKNYFNYKYLTKFPFVFIYLYKNSQRRKLIRAGRLEGSIFLKVSENYRPKKVGQTVRFICMLYLFKFSTFSCCLDLFEYSFPTRPNFFFPRQAYVLHVSIINFVFHLNMVTSLLKVVDEELKYFLINVSKYLSK